MSVDRFRTLAGTSEGIYRELASKFMAQAFPIADDSAFKHTVERITKEHPSARHVCYAWVLGEGGDRHRANDDGEPNATAGKPILRQIQALDLTFCAVVVVRYFGGTLLGRPGLIHAYGEAARLALAGASIIERIVMERALVTCGYDRFDGMKADVLTQGGTIIGTEFTERCTAIIDLPKGTLVKVQPTWTLQGILLERQ